MLLAKQEKRIKLIVNIGEIIKKSSSPFDTKTAIKLPNRKSNIKNFGVNELLTPPTSKDRTNDQQEQTIQELLDHKTV